MLEKQIEALLLRISRGGDAEQLQHYEKVLQEHRRALAGLPKDVNVPEVEVMKPKECMNRKDSTSSTGLNSMSTGIWDDMPGVIVELRDFNFDLFPDTEDEEEEVPVQWQPPPYKVGPL